MSCTVYSENGICNVYYGAFDGVVYSVVYAQ